MNTNHNRIKVSDLETDEPDKILVTNSKGELEFIATKNIKVDSYNALDYDQEGKALDARQGKILKDLVNNKTDKGGFQGTAQDLANSIPDLNSLNLKLGSYSSTRNDGQLSTNKVLSTDTSGNLKLYSLPTSTYPAPYLTEIPHNNYLPNTTGNIVLKGSFFTPNMTVLIQGQTVNNINFKSDNEIDVNVTTGSAEGTFDITLDNGISKTFTKRLLIVLGEAFTPKASDYTILAGSPDLSTDGEFRTPLLNIQQTATFFNIPNGQNFRVYFTLSRSPLGASGNGPTAPSVSLVDATNNAMKFACLVYLNNTDTESNTEAYQESTGFNYPNGQGILSGFVMLTNPPSAYFERVGTQYRLKNAYKTIVFSDTFVGALKIRVDAKHFDITGLKYVKLL